MLTPIITIPIGLLLGFLAGLGIGGGSLLILWLTLVENSAQEEARAINLMFFLAAAGSVSLFRWKNGTLKIKTILPAILCGCFASGCSSLLATHIDQTILQKIFGGLLLITGVRELFYRPQNAK